LPGIVIKQGVVTDTTILGSGATGIAFGGFGDVELYESGVATGVTIDAYLDWIHGDEDIGTDRKVFVSKFIDDGKWRIIAADCEPEPASAPPGHGDSITADPNTPHTIANAKALSYRVNRVTTVAVALDAVKLPDFEQGADCFIQNAGANTLQIFPEDAGDQIDAATAGTSVTLAAGASAHFFWVQADEIVT
jgi:hypothetical protein